MLNWWLMIAPFSKKNLIHTATSSQKSKLSGIRCLTKCMQTVTGTNLSQFVMYIIGQADDPCYTSHVTNWFFLWYRWIVEMLILLTYVKNSRHWFDIKCRHMLYSYQLSDWLTGRVGFNVPRTRHIIGHFGDESFQAIDCTGTDNQQQWIKTPHTH